MHNSCFARWLLCILPCLWIALEATLLPLDSWAWVPSELLRQLQDAVADLVAWDPWA